MVFILCLVCFFSTVGGVLVGQSLKGLLIFKAGLEKGQRQMFRIGLGAVAVAVVLALIALFIPLP